MLYLYNKDIDGFEICERFDSEKDLQKYCFQNLPKNDDYMIASVVRPGDAPDTWTADADSSPNMRAIAACVEQAEEGGMQRPFWIVCLGDCDYEAAQDEADVDFYELCKIWEDWGDYKITLRRYASGEITPEQARGRGMYLLADYIREDAAIADEDEDEDEDEE